QSKTIYFRLVADHRVEGTERLHIFINSTLVSKVRVIGTQEVTLNIVDNDDAAGGNGASTFVDLMASDGILRNEWLRCHNTIDRRGGYDMTNYWQMVGETILLPGNIESLMFARMNPDSPLFSANQNLQSMPPPASAGGNGFLNQTLRDTVGAWI